MIKNLCIVGGGTSGLVAALMIKTAWPKLDVTVIESSKIGIIGVGEGTTEHWKKFIDHVGIDVPDLFRNAGATFKIGIKFTNWHGDGTHYWHSLSEQYGSHSRENGLPYFFLQAVADNIDPVDTTWRLTRESRHVEPLHSTLNQFHFDTFKLNKFLHDKARMIGVTFIDTEIIDVKLDEQGYVKSLIDKDNISREYEFFIDCSGFKRIIGSKLGFKWIDKSEQLPLNSAIAFPTPMTDGILPSYTDSAARSAGWTWRIPTQERYGNGYVFSDAFITEQQAIDEITSIYGDVSIGRKVKFSAGHTDQFWIKNCIVAGLSSVFVEPLEASSIGTTIQQIFLTLPAFFYYSREDGGKTAKKHNEYMSKISSNIVDFIQLHYLTQRDDTEFWKWCKHNIKLTDFNKESLDFFRKNFVYSHYFNEPMLMFTHLNWTQVMHGLRLFDSAAIKEKFNEQMAKYRQENLKTIEQEEYHYNNVSSVSHREAVEILKSRYLNEEHTYKF